eukprot:gene1195-1508_t
MSFFGGHNHSHGGGGGGNHGHSHGSSGGGNHGHSHGGGGGNHGHSHGGGDHGHSHGGGGNHGHSHGEGQQQMMPTNGEIPFLQIITPTQLLSVPPVMVEQYNVLLEKWAEQELSKSEYPYVPLIPYKQVLILLEIAKNGSIKEYTDYLEKIHADLVESGKNVPMKQLINLTDTTGNSSLHYAVLKKQQRMIAHLIDNGAIIDLPNKAEGHTPLHWACISADAYVVYLLVERGADPQYIDKRGYNALLHAAQYNQIHSVRYLIEKGLSVHSKDYQNHTAVHWAAYQGHYNMARFFIHKGVDVNCVDSQGRTPLHWACLKGHKQVISMLCTEGADKKAKDQEGKTPYELAQSKNFDEATKFLNQMDKEDSLFNGSMKQYNEFWLMMGVLTVIVPMILGCYLPFLVALPTILGLVYLGKVYVVDRYFVDSRNNWYQPTLLYASVIVWYVIYLTRMLTVTININFIPHLFINPMIWYFLYFFIRLVKDDPGSISNRQSVETANKIFIDQLSSNQKLPLICPTCLINRPIRSKHCPYCNNCFARFDHHCTTYEQILEIRSAHSHSHGGNDHSPKEDNSQEGFHVDQTNFSMGGSWDHGIGRVITRNHPMIPCNDPPVSRNPIILCPIIP